MSLRVSTDSLEVTIGLLKTLSDEERIILGLYFYEELTTDQIASILNKSTNHVQDTLQRILRYMERSFVPENQPIDRFIEQMFG